MKRPFFHFSIVMILTVSVWHVKSSSEVADSSLELEQGTCAATHLESVVEDPYKYQPKRRRLDSHEASTNT